MVAVVHHQVQQRHKPVEAERADALPLQHLGVVVRQQGQAAGVVVNDAHVQPGGGFAAQDLMDLPPHLALTDDKALNINAVFGAFQRGQHGGKHRFAAGVVGRCRAVIHRRGGVIPQVAGGSRSARVLALQLLLGKGVSLAQGCQRRLGTLQFAAQNARGALVAPQQVQQPALHRHDHKQNHPADFKFRRGGILPDER